MKIPIINSVQITSLIKEYMLAKVALQLSKKDLRVNALNAKRISKVKIIKNAKNVCKNTIPDVLMSKIPRNLFVMYANKFRMLQETLINRL